MAKHALDVAAGYRALFETGRPEAASATGLSPADIQVLIALWAEPGQSVGELAARLNIRSQTVSGSLVRLVGGGLCNAGNVSEDQRERRQQVTARGARRVTEILDQMLG